MAKSAAQIVVELIDNASGPAKKIASALREVQGSKSTQAARKLDAAQTGLSKSSAAVTARLGPQAFATAKVGKAMQAAALPARKLVAINSELASGAAKATAVVARQTKVEAQQAVVREKAAKQAEGAARRARYHYKRAAAEGVALPGVAVRPGGSPRPNKGQPQRDMIGGMGASGRVQLDRIVSNRKLVDGMNAAGRRQRDSGSGSAPLPATQRRQPLRPSRSERGGSRTVINSENVGPIAGVIGAAGAASAYKEAAQYDRRLTMIGITADATVGQVDGVRAAIADLAKETALPREGVAGGLEALVAQGRSLKEAQEFLPSVARTAAASGSEVEDIAKTADSVGSNFEIAGGRMQKAFDIMAAGGKAGQFELKDMARYLPSLGPATAAIGFKGEKGLADLVSMLQTMRKGSGTAEEAVASMNNVLMKMESDTTTKKFKGMGVDAEAAFKKARKEGRNLVEVFEELLQTATKGDKSKIGELIQDQEFKRGALALMQFRGNWQKLSATLQESSGGTIANDITRVMNDSAASVQRTENAVKDLYSSLAKLADKGGVSAGLEESSKELSSLASAMERVGKAYSDKGVKGALDQILGDSRKGQLENRADALEGRAKQETGRIAELEAARDAHRTKLEGEGRAPAEIADAMRIREAEIKRVRRRAGAVDKAKGDIKDEQRALTKTPPSMLADPLAPIRGQSAPIGAGGIGSNHGKAFGEMYPVTPNPKPTPLPPPRPSGLPKSSVVQMDSVENMLGPAKKGEVQVTPILAPGSLEALKEQIKSTSAPPEITLPEQAVTAPAVAAAAKITAATSALASYKSELSGINSQLAGLEASGEAAFSPDLGGLQSRKAELEGLIDGVKAKIEGLNTTTIKPQADGSGLGTLDAAADVTKGKLAEVGGISVSPTVDTGSINAAIAAATQLKSILASIPGVASTAVAAVGRASAPSASATSASTAGGAARQIARSRQTSMTANV